MLVYCRCLGLGGGGAALLARSDAEREAGAGAGAGAELGGDTAHRGPAPAGTRDIDWNSAQLKTEVAVLNVP